MIILYRFLRSIALVISMVAPTLLDAQTPTWVSNGPYGGSILSLAVGRDGSIVAGTTVSPFFSTDRGSTWTGGAATRSAYSGDLGAAVLPIAIDSAGRLVSSIHSGIVRSTDRGITWTQAPEEGNLSRLGQITSLAIASDNSVFGIASGSLFRLPPDNSSGVMLGKVSLGYRVQAFTVTPAGILFVAVRGGMLYRSNDGGESWERTDGGFIDTTTVVRELLRMGDGTIVAGTSRGLVRSFDGGDNWVTDTSSIRERDIRDLLEAGGQLYAGTFGFGVFSSNDRGGTWREINNGLQNPNVSSLAADEVGGLYCGTLHGFHRSTDRGSSWQATNQGLRAVSSQVVVTSRGSVLATTTTGVFRSTDAGGSWHDSNFQLTDRDVKAVCVDSSGSIWMLTGNASLMKSTDDGVSWTRGGFAPRAGWLGALSASSSGELFAAVWPQGDFLGAVYSSTDGGGSWTRLYNAVFVVKIIVAGETIVLVSAADGVYRTTGGRSTWSHISIGGGSNGRQLMNATVGPDRTMYIGSGHGAYRSTDDGVTWQEIGPEPRMNGSKSLAIVYALGVDPSGQLIAAMSAGHGPVFLSSNQGSTWTDASGGLEGVTGGSIAVRGPGEFFLGTDRGVYQISNLVSAIEPVAKGLFGMNLEECRPNPVGDEGTISLSIPSRCMVSLVLFDTEGNQVERLFEERVEAGRHTVDLNVSSLPRGVYLCRMVAGGEVTAKLVTVVH